MIHVFWNLRGVSVKSAQDVRLYAFMPFVLLFSAMCFLRDCFAQNMRPAVECGGILNSSQNPKNPREYQT